MSVRYGTVRYGTVPVRYRSLYSNVLPFKGLYSTVRYGTVRYGIVWTYGMVRYGKSIRYVGTTVARSVVPYDSGTVRSGMQLRFFLGFLRFRFS